MPVDSFLPRLVDIIVECVKKKQRKQVEALFDLLIDHPETALVWSCWFDLEEGETKPTLLTNDIRCHMIKHMCMAIYNVIDKASEKKDKNQKPNEDVILFLLKCKLPLLITSVLQDDGNSGIYGKITNTSTIFIALMVMKLIIGLSKYRQSTHSNVLLQHNTVEMLLGILNMERPSLCMLAALDILCCFSLEHREALERIMKSNGCHVLISFIKKDDTQKMLLDAGVDGDFFTFEGCNFEYTFENIPLCVKLKKSDWIVSKETSKDVALPLLHQGFNMKKTAMKILVQITNMNDRYRLALYNTENYIKLILGWLRAPAIDPSMHIMIQLSTHNLANLLLSEEVAHKLIRVDNLIEYLTTGFYSAEWHVARQYLMVIFAIARHGGYIRDMLAEKQDIFNVLVCHMYSLDEEVQPAVMALLAEFAQSRKTAIELHKAGCTPQLLQDTGHFYGHSFRNQMDIVRKGFTKYVKSWRKEQNNVVRRSNQDEHSIRAGVERLKEAGNQEFKKEQYLTAIELYSNGLKGCPIRIKCPEGTECPSWSAKLLDTSDVYHWWVLPATLFANRAQCYLKLKDWKLCISDCTKAICSCWIPGDEGGPVRNNIFMKAVYRRARAWFEMKEYDKALNDVCCCVELSPDDPVFMKMKKECVLLHRKYYRREAIRHCGHCGAGEGISLRRCANCCEVYCSKDCQMNDWNSGHKELCHLLSKK